MKKLKWYFVLLLSIVSLQLTQAQTSPNEKETIIATKKKEAKIVKHDGITFYVIDGLWHTKMKNKYVLRAAPKGARLDFIPTGGKLVQMGGKKYYKCKGVFYIKTKDGNYEVSRP